MITPRARIAADGTVSWQIPFRLGGRQTSETFVSEKAAWAFSKLGSQIGWTAALAILEQRATSSMHLMTLAEWCATYVDDLVGVEEGTRRTYRAYIRRDLAAIGPLPLDAVTKDAIGAWVKGMLAAGASGHTIKNKHGFVSGALTAAVITGLIPGNPCRGMRLPKTEREEMTFLTHADFAHLVGYVPPRMVPFVTTLVGTGLRFGEATALQVRDVSLEDGTLRVSRAWKATMGQGHRLGPPKSDMSRRTIALAPETVEVLRPLVDGRPGTAFVFTNTRGGPIRQSSFSADIWLPAVRLANGEPARKTTIGPDGKPRLGKRVTRRTDATGRLIVPATVPLGKRPTPHDLRHSYASWLLAAGVDIYTVSRSMGHENITTTTSSYGFLMPGSQTAVSEAMSRALTLALPQIEPPDEPPDEDEPLEIES